MSSPSSPASTGSSPAILASRLPAAGHVRPRRDPRWMLNQLPVALVSEDFFSRFVSIFQELGSTLLEDADNIDHVIDLTVAPLPMVRWLGSWIGLAPLDDSLPEDLQRRIVRSAARTMTRRGTVEGLRAFLALVTGEEVLVEEGGGVWRQGEAPADTAWLTIRTSTSGLLRHEELVAVVEDEIPAHVVAELYVGSDLVWTTERGGERS